MKDSKNEKKRWEEGGSKVGILGASRHLVSLPAFAVVLCTVSFALAFSPLFSLAFSLLFLSFFFVFGPSLASPAVGEAL